MAKDIADIKTKNQNQDTLIQGLDAEIDANKQAAEKAVSDLEDALIGDAETYTDLGKAEDAIIAAKAQADKGVADAKAASDAAAQVQTNLNATNVKVTAAEADIDDLQARMTTAEGEIDALQAADTTIRGEFAAADTALKNELKGDATTYTDLGKAEDAIQANTGSINTINTQITAINANLTWETFE
jgi:chromosome segregation ATPase